MLTCWCSWRSTEDWGRGANVAEGENPLANSVQDCFRGLETVHYGRSHSAGG